MRHLCVSGRGLARRRLHEPGRNGFAVGVVLEEGPGFVQRSGNGWPLHQPFEVVGQQRVLGGNGHQRGGVEERGRCGAVGHAEVVAREPGAAIQLLVEEPVGHGERGPRLGHGVGAAVGLGVDAVGHDGLHGGHDVEVRQAVHQAHFQRLPGVLGNEGLVRRGVLLHQVFDDDAGLGDGAGAVLQQRHLAGGPERDEVGALFRVTQVEQPGFERGLQFVERDERLVAARRQRVVVEREGHGGFILSESRGSRWTSH